MPSVAHHYIPQFHLREFGIGTFRVAGVPGRFGRRSGTIWQYDKQTGEITWSSVEKAAQRPNYYAVPGHPDELEDAFEHLEGVVAPIVQRIHDLQSGVRGLAQSERLELATYVALLNMRAPAYRDPMTALATFGAGTLLDMRLSSAEGYRQDMRRRGDKRSDEEIEEGRVRLQSNLRAGEVRVQARDEHSLLGLRVLEEAALMLVAMSWGFIRTAPFHRLVLGDQPVIFVPPPNYPRTEAVGPGVPGVVVCLPLSPTGLLVMSKGVPDAPAFWVRDEDAPGIDVPMATEANALSWRWAQRFVYGRSRADLESVLLGMPESLRQAAPKFYAFNVPEVWLQYLGEGTIAARDRQLPPDVFGFATLLGDVEVELDDRLTDGHDVPA